MNDPAIKVENLGKLYHIGSLQERYSTLRETLVRSFERPLHRMQLKFQGSRVQSIAKLKVGTSDDFIWALKDVTFEFKRGEVVGIIGRNGAGKSTLLKILAHITEPTKGRVELRGRVGSLLEVGTGFHPELTGRENIYLNGAILGMKKLEIERKFDEIVDFSEIEKFLDTPAKHYSSGMYVRLAFAVAAHLEPDILLIDEVLAVGDVAFQRKCLGKIGDVVKQGRTVLFVSHNLVAIQALCSRTLLLNKGNLVEDGLSSEVIKHYLSLLSIGTNQQSVSSLSRVTGGNEIRLIAIELVDENELVTDTFEFGSEMRVRFTIRVKDKRRKFFSIEWFISTDYGEKVFYCSTSPQQSILIQVVDEVITVECHISSLNLASGSYFINCMLSIPHQERLDEVEGVARFIVTRCDPWNTGFNLTNTIALTTTTNVQWQIIAGGIQMLP
jgi:lipopolysaccharide transport system ATP-binding protein